MHWKAPSIMLGAFVAGIGFAIGHHLFYYSLNGQAVGSTTFSQQVNIGAGTAFAFLVKTCLVLAVGTAFVQVLWRCLTPNSASVARIDSVTQLLTSFIELFSLSTLARYPFLMLLAVVSWTLPLAVIVPPATLSVSTSGVPVRRFGLHSVPSLDLANLSCSHNVISEFKTSESTRTITQFGGSSDDMTALALSVALSANIPKVFPPSPNSSYSLQFYAPSLQCSEASVTILDGFSSILGCNVTERGCEAWYHYLSWVPEKGKRVPFNNTDVINGLIDFGDTRTGGYSDDEPAVIYFANNMRLGGWELLNCSLYNASYDVEFNNSNGDQSIHVLKEHLNGVQYQSAVSSELCIQDESCNSITSMTPEEVEYLGVMDSFGKILVGSISHIKVFLDVNTTTLSLDVTDTFYTLLNFPDTPNTSDTTVETLSFARELEQLFENITLALLANTDKFTDDSSLYASSAANVTFLSYPNVYLYNWRHLVLSYGLAVLFTTICVAIGCYNMFSSGCSFSFTFSTIARVTRDPAWDRLIRVEDTDGVDPLPKHMSDVKMPVGSLASSLSNRHVDPEDAPLKHGEVVQIHVDNSMDGEELRYLMSPNQVSGCDGYEQPSADLRRR